MRLSRFKQHSVFLVIFLVGILLRFLPLGQYQLSHDELSALSRTIFPNLSQEIIYGAQYTDTHPILVQVFLFYWIKLAGSSEIAIKLPFLLCGIASTWVIYRFTLKWFGLQAAIYATLITSVSFIFVLYSTYARMYAPGVLLSVGVIYYLFNIVFGHRPTTRDYICFGLLCLLCGFNNHLNALFALTCGLAGLLLIRRQQWLPYLVTNLAVVICYLPHLPITLTQLQTGGLGTADNGWLPPPNNTVLFDFLKTLFGTGYVGLCILVVSLLVVITGLVPGSRLSKKQVLLVVLFLANYGIIHLYSIVRSPVLQYSVLLFSAPCLVVGFASFFGRLSKQVFYGLTVVMLAGLLLQDLMVKQGLDDVHRQGFEMMARETLREVEQYGDQAVTALYTAEPYFIRYYEAKFQHRLPYKLTSDNMPADVPRMRAYFRQLPPTVNHFVLGDVSPLMVELTRERFPVITRHQQGYFYNVLTLSADKHARPAADDALLNTWDLFRSLGSFRCDTRVKPLDGVYRLDSTGEEFPLAYRTRFSDLGLRGGQWLLAEVTFEAGGPQRLEHDMLCFSVNMPDSSRHCFTAAKFADFMTGQGRQKLYLQLFCGSDTPLWSTLR